MVRMAKQEERRAKCPHKCKYPSKKSGSLKDNLPKGYKEHQSASAVEKTFIPKIK